MREELLDEIRKTIWKLVDIVNDQKDVKLTRREAYLAVRTMDLVEPLISHIEDKYYSGGPRNE